MRDYTNGASLAWRLFRRISTVMFTCGWAWLARWPFRTILTLGDFNFWSYDPMALYEYLYYYYYDSLPWTPTNLLAKYDATSFILGGEICNRTNKHTHTVTQTNSNRYIHTLLLLFLLLLLLLRPPARCQLGGRTISQHHIDVWITTVSQFLLNQLTVNHIKWDVAMLGFLIGYSPDNILGACPPHPSIELSLRARPWEKKQQVWCVSAKSQIDLARSTWRRTVNKSDSITFFFVLFGRICKLKRNAITDTCICSLPIMSR